MLYIILHNDIVFSNMTEGRIYMDFTLSLNTKIQNPFSDASIENAVSILTRDMHRQRHQLREEKRKQHSRQRHQPPAAACIYVQHGIYSARIRTQRMYARRISGYNKLHTHANDQESGARSAGQLQQG